MGFYSALANEQRRCNFAVRLTGQNVLEYLLFSDSQFFQGLHLPDDICLLGHAHPIIGDEIYVVIE